MYVVHLSSAPALAEVREARERGVDVIAETCPQYLYLDTARLDRIPTASRSCARRRCATRGTSRSCGTASRPARCTPSRPTTARSPSPTGARARATGPRATPTSPRSRAACPASRPAWDSCGKAWPAGRITARRLGAAVRRGAGAHVRAVARQGQPARRRRRRRRGVGSRRATQSLDADALHMAVDHSPYHGMTVTGWPELVFARGDLVARDGRYVGEPARGRYVGRTPRTGVRSRPATSSRVSRSAFR